VHVHNAHSDPICCSRPLLSSFNDELYNSEVPRAPVMTASENDALRQVMAD
jgi:hypothetical protein